MIRRRLTLKRVDPWSVLKFGFVINIALMLVGMLGFWILWIVIGRLGLVEQFCDSVGSIVLDLQECSINGGNIFRTLLVLGLLGVVVQTGIMVFGAFLYNLIADLTGGLGFTFLDESGDAVRDARSSDGSTTGTRAVTGGSTTGARTGAAAGAASSAASSASSASSTTPRSAGGPPDQSSVPRERTPDGPPPTPGRSPSSSPSSGDSGDGPPRGPSSSPGSDRPGSSGGSLWGDPTRSNDRS